MARASCLSMAMLSSAACFYIEVSDSDAKEGLASRFSVVDSLHIAAPEASDAFKSPPTLKKNRAEAPALITVPKKIITCLEVDVMPPRVE